MSSLTTKIFVAAGALFASTGCVTGDDETVDEAPAASEAPEASEDVTEPTAGEEDQTDGKSTDGQSE